MINFKKLVAIFLSGCMACQGVGTFQAAAMKPGVGFDLSFGSGGYSGTLLDNIINVDDLIKKCKDREKLGEPVDDDFVAEWLSGSIACFGGRTTKEQKPRGPVAEIVSRLDEVEFTAEESAVIIKFCVNSFKLFLHLKMAHCFSSGKKNIIFEGCVNNLLIAIACLYKCNFPKVASVLYSWFFKYESDKVKLLPGVIRVVDPSKDNKALGAGVGTCTRQLLHQISDLIGIYDDFDGGLVDVVTVEDELERAFSTLVEMQEEKRREEYQKKMDRRAAQRAEKDEARRKAEEEAKRRDADIARKKEEEEDKKRAEERAARDAAEAVRRQEEARLKAEHDASGVTAVIEANASIWKSHANEPNHDDRGLKFKQ